MRVLVNITYCIHVVDSCFDLLTCVMLVMHSISSFAHDPSKAGPELQPCLDKAKDVVPRQQHATTPIFLGATAGMRLLR